MQSGEPAMDRRSAAAGVAAVDDVVVDQGARVQQLEGRRRTDDVRAIGRTGRAVSPVAEGWSQPFAALKDECARSVGEWRELVGNMTERRGCLIEELDESPLDASCQGVHAVNCR
jgi:hypothetical protein